MVTFAVGGFFNNPDKWNAANQALFNQDYASFVSTMGIIPQYDDTFIDYTTPISNWVANTTAQAESDAATPAAKAMVPVIGLPMYSNAAGSSTPDQQYQAIASGSYDSVLQGIVKAWAQQGFTTLDFRPGWEMNLQGTPTYVGSDAQSQADWVKAFQHIYTVLHQAAAADGVNVQVIWNPGTTSYSPVNAITTLYPGNNYVDIIGADAYADMAPYSDSSTTTSYHDWATGGEDTSLAQFIANPVNREHYWTYPAANEWTNDASGGHSLSLDSLMSFAEQQGKPFAIPETGAGNTANGADVWDDPTFPQWLSSQLTAAQSAGLNVRFVNIWDANMGGTYQFSNASDEKPQEAASWAQYFGAQSSGSSASGSSASGSSASGSSASSGTVSSSTTQGAQLATTTIGSGSDTVSLQMNEDYYLANATFTVSVDGTQVGGLQTVEALRDLGQWQSFNIDGNWGAGQHTVAVDFTNDAYGGSAALDRNLYVTNASYNGITDTNHTLSLLSSGTQTLTVG